MSLTSRWSRCAPLALAALFYATTIPAQEGDESSSLVAEDLLLDEMLSGELAPREEMETADESPQTNAAAEDAAADNDDLLFDFDAPAVPQDEAAEEDATVEELAADVLGDEPTAVEEELDLLLVEEPVDEALVLEEPVVEEAEEEPVDLTADFGFPVASEEKGAEPEGVEELAEEALGEEVATPPDNAADDLLLDLGLEEPAEEAPAQGQFAAEEEQPPAEPVVLEEEVQAERPAPQPSDDVTAAVVEEESDDAVRPEEPAPMAAEVQAPATVEEPEIPDSVTVLMEAEQLKRKAYRNHAISTIDLGQQALSERRYQRARTTFENALETLDRLGRRAEDDRIRRRAREGLAETFYRWAIAFREQEDLEAAGQMARNASTYGHRKAPRLVGEIEQAKVDPPPPPPPADIPRWKEEDFQEAEADIAARLKEGRQLYMTGELRKAENHFKSILHSDPFNTEAIRMLEKTNQKMRQIATLELEATRAKMLRDLRQAWNPRDYGLAIEDQADITGSDVPKPDDKLQSQRVRILRKMENIIIPEIEFRQANIHDVVNFLQSASIEYDDTETDDAKQGVNIILNLQASESDTPSAPTMDDPFAAAPAASSPQPGGVPLITFSARQISLLEALKIVTKVANLKYRIEGSVVMMLPFDAPTGEVIVRTYDVLPSVEERLSTVGAQLSQPTGFGASRPMGGGGFGASDTGATSGEAVNWKSAFEEMGVQWPQGTSIKYVRAMGKLVVANTADNLTVFEQILSELNVTPTQIEIEARFVEVNQTDLDSLGFEWLLTDNWEIAQQTGQGNVPLSARQRIIMQQNAGNGGFTAGNRFLQGGAGLAGTTVADNLMTISSVLTNPELSVVLHALQQRGSTDLLSAPKVLTQSGVEATIKVVTEYVYPTDFEVTPITAAAQGGAGDSQIVGGVVEPSGFEVREVGVILTVTPEVSPEGQMIDLTMRPEVVSDPVWKNYGTTYTDSNGNTQQLAMEQPFFFTRSISSTISIYDNATVVMGGMITENRSTVNDRIPFLGDIPLIGRLFRSSYEQSEKRNLLIFVTARLVDPAGRPVKGGGAAAAQL